MNGCWQGPGLYPLVYSVYGVSSPIVGTDSQIRVRGWTKFCVPGLPDAWRFGGGQCEGANRIALSRSSAQLGCPTLDETGKDTVITFIGIDVDNSLFIRLAEEHVSHPVTPDPLKRYTVWVVTFDFTHASAGPSPVDLSSCGGADLPGELSFDFAEMLGADGIGRNLQNCDFTSGGAEANWNGGFQPCDFFHPVSAQTSPCGPVPTQLTTWGRVKATYR